MCLATLGIIGAGISAGGTLMNGMAQSQAASYQAQVASNNAIIAQQNAVHAEQAGAQQTDAMSKKGAAQEAAIRGAIAANGVDVNSGSAVDVQTSARETSKLDTLTTDNNAQLQVYGYRTQATNYQAQSQLDQMTAASAPIGAAFGATGSLLSNASSIGLKNGGNMGILSSLWGG